MAEFLAFLPDHLTAAAFVATLFGVQWLQFKITSKPVEPMVQSERQLAFVEVSMPDDLRRFFATGAI